MKRVDCERGCASFILSSLSFPPFLCDTRLQVLWGNWLHNQTFPNFEHFDACSSAVMGRGEQRQQWVQRYFFILIVKTTAILYSFSVLIMSLRKKTFNSSSKINIVHYNSSCLHTDLPAPLHTSFSTHEQLIHTNDEYWQIHIHIQMHSHTQTFVTNERRKQLNTHSIDSSRRTKRPSGNPVQVISWTFICDNSTTFD